MRTLNITVQIPIVKASQSEFISTNTKENAHTKHSREKNQNELFKMSEAKADFTISSLSQQSFRFARFDVPVSMSFFPSQPHCICLCDKVS